MRPGRGSRRLGPGEIALEPVEQDVEEDEIEGPGGGFVRAGLLFYGAMLAAAAIWRVGFQGQPLLFATPEAEARGVSWLLDLGLGAIIKYLGPVYPAQQLAMFRNLFGLVPCIVVLTYLVLVANCESIIRSPCFTFPYEKSLRIKR